MLKDQLRDELVRQARTGLPVTYKELARRLALSPPGTMHRVTEALEQLMADSRAKRNGLSEADLHVFAKLLEQGLERGEEAEALPRREIVAEDDLLQLGVAHGVQVDVPRQVAA